MGLLEDKICVVTGAAGGIGSAIAALFVKEGAMVIGIERTEGSISERSADFPYSDRIVPYCADITSEQEIKTLVQTVKRNYKKIDVLVNVAGFEANERIGFITGENMDKMFRTNVYGTIEMLQYVSRIMMRQPNGGSIINISSVVGIHGNPGQLVYSATKGAVNSLTLSAAKELAPYKIRVNAIAPGLTRTKMIENTAPEYIEKRLANIPLGRIAEPADIANMAAFLASDHAAYLTGQIIGVDGGTIM